MASLPLPCSLTYPWPTCCCFSHLPWLSVCHMVLLLPPHLILSQRATTNSCRLHRPLYSLHFCFSYFLSSSIFFDAGSWMLPNINTNSPVYWDIKPCNGRHDQPDRPNELDSYRAKVAQIIGQVQGIITRYLLTASITVTKILDVHAYDVCTSYTSTLGHFKTKEMMCI